MFLLFMLPAVDEVPVPPAPVAVEVVEVPTYNGAPLPVEITEGVTLVQSDGFTVTLDPASLAPERRSDADLCRDLQEVKPWIDWGCV